MQRIYLRSDEIRILRLWLKELSAKLEDNDGSESESLSVRELQVLRLLASGRSNVQIAADLGLTINTVKTHVSALLSKLHAPNTRTAVAVALNLKILTPTDFKPKI